MIVRKTFEELKQALEPAREQMVWKNPVVEVVETGLYNVSNSRGGFYRVTCGRHGSGSLFVDCLCKANQVWKPCYHALAAFEKHVEIKIVEKWRK